MEAQGLKIEDGKADVRPLRLFVAISPPENVKDEIEKAQRELRAALTGNFVRWTRRAQFHLTLKFLGNVAEARIAELIEALRKACVHFTALRLRAAGISFFPDARRPRVVWAGVQDDEGALVRLQQSIEAGVKDFVASDADPGSAGVSSTLRGAATEDGPARFENVGCDSDSPPGRRRSQAFTGHITLGRIQRIQRREAEILAEAASGAAKQFFGEWLAEAVELIRSELLPAGSRYTTVAAIPLSGLYEPSVR